MTSEPKQTRWLCWLCHEPLQPNEQGQLRCVNIECGEPILEDHEQMMKRLDKLRRRRKRRTQ